MNNTCSYKRKEGTSLHIVRNHWRLNLLLCYTCIANKGLQGVMKSWWRVSLLINRAQERCYAAKSREAKLQSCNLTSRFNLGVTQVPADCDCSPHILFTSKSLMVPLLLLIMLEMFPASVIQFVDTVKIFLCSQHAFVIKKTPLAYWSTVPVNEDNFIHAHTCPKSVLGGSLQ